MNATLELTGLGPLHDALRRAGYTVIGPTVRDEAIVLAELDSIDRLPYGWGVRLGPGGYRLRRRDDGAAFAHAAGPQSWKPFLHRSRVKLWEATRTGDGFEVRDRPPEPERLALLGVRPCDLRAIAVQDRVLTGGRHADPSYAARRDGAFIVAVNCTEPGETCFCVSMGTGPQAGPGYDLALTELTGEDGPRYIVDVGTDAGALVLDGIGAAPADPGDVDRARAEVTAAAGRMGREMPALGLRDLMADSLDAARWDEVAERCLSCGNCTMVCPTCFCTRVTDTTDLSGDHAERWQLWDSCFDPDFSHLHGGDVRASAKSRYRQWLTHKLGTWHDQFGSSGCVGCGRCIVWCPVGIDLTVEVAALRAEAAEATEAADRGTG
ncbi:4Fe-4S dicluster domain-containing protein [Actinomadura chibensis]|uniref:4Fe-4S ferredoxin n=1 Tax=Actinomadura chibensis TaxID=392828 RepID=A0A5D0NHS5_9ACTN|nr:4Fe-4S dicluster domain-containing protein [Actinomadura chibensis]TYB43922.1 4Fe-4S ferredoxin [Actinomadura chibensis]